MKRQRITAFRHKSLLGEHRFSPCGVWTLMHDVQDETPFWGLPDDWMALPPGSYLSPSGGGCDVCCTGDRERTWARIRFFHPNSCWKSSNGRYIWKTTHSSLAHYFELDSSNKEVNCPGVLPPPQFICSTASSVNSPHEFSSDYFIHKSLLTASSKARSDFYPLKFVWTHMYFQAFRPDISAWVNYITIE